MVHSLDQHLSVGSPACSEEFNCTRTARGAANLTNHRRIHLADVTKSHRDHFCLHNVLQCGQYRQIPS